jgi:hypothetical protein
MSRPTIVPAACAISLALGLFFVFVWAPHPWGWEGFDHYHQLALALAAGQPFPTMDVPWGYAYFAAAFYGVFGDRPWVLLIAQVLLNGAVPWLVYRVALEWTDRHTAVVAALITGIFSFNTIYASTQSSDSVCTVIFMASLVVFGAARRRQRWQEFGVAGLLTGLAPQFRPNLILMPLLLAAYAVFERRTRARLTGAAVLLACAAAALAPWVWRNYRLTHSVLPTSVHGGVQLWYGTLQTGPYLHSRAYNPRSVFEAPVFDYTSLDTVPILVTAHPKACAEAPPSSSALIYWTDGDPTPRRVAPVSLDEHGLLTFDIPPPGAPVVLYYYFDATWSIDGVAVRRPTPVGGAAAPFVYFVAHDHLGDLDRHGDLLDIFDLVRLARHTAWGEPMVFEAELARAGVDSPEQAADTLAAPFSRAAAGTHALSGIVHDDVGARVTFRDGSSIGIPRAWRGRITDLSVTGPLAQAIMSSTVSLASLERTASHRAPDHQTACAQMEDVEVNRVFYRQEPHQMRRYSALAFDNIAREPFAFARATAYRAFRVFVIQATDDVQTAQQFTQSSVIYRVGAAATVVTLLLFVAGIAVAWRRGEPILFLLLLVAYVPLTVAPVLTNMRYSVTVQPLVFIFIAAALTGARGAAGTRTARRP